MSGNSESKVESIDDLSPGDRVLHVGRAAHDSGLGTVETVTEKCAQILFDDPSPSGKPSRGVFDNNWFRAVGLLQHASIERTNRE
jgi:hypothetical protein